VDKLDDDDPLVVRLDVMPERYVSLKPR